MRICFVCNEYPPGPHGGIGTLNCVLARSLVAAGHEVRVIGMYEQGYPAHAYEEDQGVRVWRLQRSASRFSWLPARYRLHHILGRWSKCGLVDLIEFPDWEGWAAGLPRLSIPVIVRLNGCASYFANELDRPLSRFTYYVERAGLRRADFWCSVSDYTAQKTKQVFALTNGPHRILYNSVEVPEEPSAGERSANQVIYTGTLTAKKGIISLIRAWPLVQQAVEQAELHVFGKDGRTDQGESMQKYLQRLVEESGCRVTFYGHVSRDELFHRLSVARAAVFPSYAEAFALAPLEAMVRGCPTIYSTRGSGSELIADGRDGLLVDPDRPERIAEAVVRLLTDDTLAEQIGRAGRRRVLQRFAVETICQENENFFRDCIEQFRLQAKPGFRLRTAQAVAP